MNQTIDAPQLTAIRDTLFGDLPLAHWAGINASGMPWDLFKQAKQHLESGHPDEAVQALLDIIAAPGLESRQYLQAWHFLGQLDVQPTTAIEVYGLVVEVAMDQGLDLLAVYADHSARYYNYTGGGIVWDQPDAVIGVKIDAIIEQGTEIIQFIGPWTDARPAAPKNGNARINILTSNGLYFGEADQMTLFKDPMAGKTMYAMLDMMETLIKKRNGG